MPLRALLASLVAEQHAWPIIDGEEAVRNFQWLVLISNRFLGLVPTPISFQQAVRKPRTSPTVSMAAEVLGRRRRNPLGGGSDPVAQFLF